MRPASTAAAAAAGCCNGAHVAHPLRPTFCTLRTERHLAAHGPAITCATAVDDRAVHRVDADDFLRT
jgi:hypothetical protein